LKWNQTEALVLATRPLGEADRLVTLLTWSKGKTSAVARGARKTKSKLAAGVDLFTRAYISLYRGKSLYTITQVEVKEKFDRFQLDPLMYSYASYFAELMYRFLVEEEQHPEMYRLLLEGWRALEYTEDYQLLARSYELKMLYFNGYSPRREECVICSRNLKPAWFSINLGGVVCNSCAGGSGEYLSVLPGSVSLAGHLEQTPFTGLNRIKASLPQKQELRKITVPFLSYHLELGKCRSLHYIEEWEKNIRVE